MRAHDHCPTEAAENSLWILLERCCRFPAGMWTVPPVQLLWSLLGAH